VTNSILNYTLEELDEFIVPDYFSKQIDLYNILNEFSDNGILMDYVQIYRISDDDKLERISYDIYGTTNYWDLLLQINDKQPLFEMPYSLDTIVDSSEEFWNNYSELVYFQAPLKSPVLEKLINTEIEKMKEQNEIFRFIYIIKPTKLQEFLKILRERDYL
jgi:hypothetical protein